MLSEEKECATSGALPPRIAATILSSFTPPTTFTRTFGCCLLEVGDDALDHAELALR